MHAARVKSLLVWSDFALIKTCRNNTLFLFLMAQFWILSAPTAYVAPAASLAAPASPMPPAAVILQYSITFIPHRQLKGDSPSAALRGAAAVASAAVAAASAAEAAVFAGWRSMVGFGQADARPKARRRTRKGRWKTNLKHIDLLRRYTWMRWKNIFQIGLQLFY